MSPSPTLPASFRRPSSAAGFTILELCVVILIIGILSAMLFESYKSFQSRAERTRCVSNLRNLHIALASYTQDQQHWPQCPFVIGDEKFDTWWMKEMSKYNLGRSNWECPTLLRLEASGEADKDEKKKMIHYVCTPFDEGPRTPFKWARQPWAVEIGDFHGDGNLILFFDGSVKGFNVFSAQSP